MLLFRLRKIENTRETIKKSTQELTKNVVKWCLIGYITTTVSEKVRDYIIELLKEREAKQIVYRLVSETLNEKLKTGGISLEKYKACLLRINKKSTVEELYESISPKQTY